MGRECRRIRNTARALAQLDCLVTLAGAAHQFGYVRPRLHSGEELAVKGGRHPVIERLGEQLSTGRFIPNDLYLNPTTDQVLLITGPNMGGKSTYLRQAALFSVMAQMGSFVSRPGGQAAHRGSDLHPHRGHRQPGPGQVHLHGGDDRDGPSS